MFDFPKRMQEVFQSKKNQKNFEKYGYVKLPFFNQEQVAFLLDVYKKLHPVEEKGFYPSTFSKDKEYRKKADQEIRRLGEESTKKYLKNEKVVCASFIVKNYGKDSIMDVHQDMTLVDESIYTGINIWCPLVDINKDNGLLYVLPKSHRIVPTYRGASIETLYKNVYNEVKKYSIPIYLKAGESVFFDQSILHWSKPNMTEKARVVTNTFFTHKEATFQTCFYTKEYKNKIEIFNQDINFMIDFEQFGNNIYDRPKVGKSVGLVDYNFPKLRAKDLDKKYKYNLQRVLSKLNIYGA